MTFKKGDKVVCVRDNPAAGLLIDTVYTVVALDSIYVRLEGVAGGWDLDRFELAAKPLSFSSTDTFVSAPVLGTFQTPGRKDDSGKLDVTLFMDDLPHAIEAVTEVLQWAITKKQPKPYERGSWQMVPDFQRRYRGAQIRHELNRAKSALAGTEPVDAETGLMELAHIATDAMFRLEMAVRKQRGLSVPEGA